MEEFIQEVKESLEEILRDVKGCEEFLKGLNNIKFPWEILDLMDIFVLPSLEEGLPVAILEAMYMAKPVVATRVTSVPEAIIGGDTGILGPPRNSDALAKAIISVLADKNKAREMGRRGRERCLKEFSSNVLIGKIEDLYESLLNEKDVNSCFP